MAQYKIQDTLTGKVFTFEGPYDTPPTDDEIEDAVFGTITAKKLNPLEKVGKWLTEPVDKVTVPTQVITPWTKEPEKIPTKEVDVPRWHQIAEDTVNLTAATLVTSELVKSIWNLPHAQYLLSKIAFKPATAGTQGTATQIDTTRVRKGMSWLAKSIAPEHEAFKPMPTRAEKIASIKEYYASKPPDVTPAKTGEEELARYNSWLQAREPTQRPELNFPLHPAPAVSLDYTNVPKTVAKTLPNEIIAPPTQEWITKTVSAFPQKVTDQKSLEEVGNAMAKEMGIQVPIEWKLKIYDKGYISGHAEYATEGKPASILIRLPNEKSSLWQVKDLRQSSEYIGGSRGKVHASMLQQTQGKIKKIIAHEMSHLLTPGESHSSIFWDEVEYHEAATLIKRELKQKGVELPALKEGNVTRKPIIQTQHFAGYKYGTAIGVVDEYGKKVGVFENQEAAQRWITSAEADFQKPKPVVKAETKATVDDLLQDPDLADSVLANPTVHDADTLDLAKQIVYDKGDQTPLQVPLEQIKAVSDAGEAIPPKPTDVPKPIIQPTETGLYDPSRQYSVTYQTIDGKPAMTTMGGGILNTIDQSLKGGKNSVDPYGHVVMKIVDVYPLKGDAGRVVLPEWEALEDTMANLEGRVQVGKEEYLSLVKKIAVPEKVDNPLFRQVYNAVQHGIDYRTELTVTGLKRLDHKFIASMTDAEKAKWNMVVKLGNELHKVYTPDELTKTFSFNEKQIRAYNNLMRMYEYSFDAVTKAKKMQSGYETMSQADKTAFDAAVAKSRANLKGYVSQERLGSEAKPWAVYVPGEEGKKAQFFNVFANKADALKTARALGSEDYVYLRKNVIHKITNRLSLSDLEELIDSAGVQDTAEVNALRDELKKRGALHHEVRRQNIPGYEWNTDNIIESAIDYLEGSSNRLARAFGKTVAERTYRQVVDKMSTDMKIFGRDFIDSAYNTGSIGYRNVSKMLYTWNLALNMKWLALNGTQPVARTYPVIARYFPTGKAEQVFLKSYDISGRYLRHLLGGGKQGMSTELIAALNKLHNQGVLGDQATRLMMGVRSIQGEQLERTLGAFGRFGEFINRSHAATSAYYIGTEKLGLEGKPLIEFMRQFVYRTQEAYGKHNLPLAITRAGDWASFFKMLYTYQHYNLANLQYINSTMPWHKGAKAGETIRALGALLAIAGIKGLPLIGTGMALYKLWKKNIKKEGGTLDYDVRKFMTEKDIPKGMQDFFLEGASGVAGAGLSASMRPDIPFTEPGGGVNFAGVPGSMLEKLYTAGVLLKKGEVTRAAEKVSPRAIENIWKAIRYHNQGVRRSNGEMLLGKEKLGWWDIALTAMGFSPTKVSKQYEAEDVKTSMLEARRAGVADVNERAAKAIFKRDRNEVRKIYQEVREYNTKVKPENRISIDMSSIRRRIQEMRGRDTGVPGRMRREFRRVEETYK